jgi:hypothetical protein
VLFRSGVYIPNIFSGLRTRHLKMNQVASSPQHRALLITASTILGITLRVIVMTVVNLSVLGFGYPLGYNMPQGAIIPILPLIALFNATLALYTIPLGYFLAEVVKSRLKLNTTS